MEVSRKVVEMMRAVEGCGSNKGNKAQLGWEVVAPARWGKPAAACSWWTRRRQ